MVRHGLKAVLLAAIIAMTPRLCAVDVDALKAEVDRIRLEIKNQDDAKLSPIAKVDETVIEQVGLDEKVRTGIGKLTVGGLVQVWYQTIQNDPRGIIVPTRFNNVGAPEPNSKLDSDTFRIRRTELRFTLELNKYVTAYVMMDPAREANVTYTPFPADPNHNSAFTNPHLADGSGQQFSNSIVPQVLQDAYIAFQNIPFIPHHDFQIGQFKPPSGEEAWRSSGLLDFVDRSMVTAVNNVRDIGIMAHGSWFYNEKDGPGAGRLQYWLGAFNGPDGTVLTDPEIVEGGNRSDDNNAKDFCWRIAGQPVWSLDKWYGRLETGIARTDGYRGKSGSTFDPNLQINSIDETLTAINRQAAWVWYRPNGPVKGWWMRGEWGSGRDRFSVRNPTDLLGFGQTDPQPVTVSGWYASTGYKLAQSIWFEKEQTCLLNKALRNSEFTFRYESFQNIAAEDTARPNVKTDLFSTKAATIGYNYYFMSGSTTDAYKARLQANYVFVNPPHDFAIGLRAPRSDQFVISFQVQY